MQIDVQISTGVRVRSCIYLEALDEYWGSSGFIGLEVQRLVSWSGASRRASHRVPFCAMLFELVRRLPA